MFRFYVNLRGCNDVFRHFLSGLPVPLFAHLWGSLTSQILPGCSFGIGTARHLGKDPKGTQVKCPSFGLDFGWTQTSFWSSWTLKPNKQTKNWHTSDLTKFEGTSKNMRFLLEFPVPGLANLVTCNFPPAWSSALKRLANISCGLKMPGQEPLRNCGGSFPRSLPPPIAGPMALGARDFPERWAPSRSWDNGVTWGPYKWPKTKWVTGVK